MKMIVGVDEAGRGPIAGPVSTGVCVVLGGFRIPKSVSDVPLRDSKKLSKHGREIWFAKIKEWQKEGKLYFQVSLISENVIDKKGIVFAINTGISRAFLKLKIKKDAEIFLDGGLRVPGEFKKQKTIIKGDEKIAVISLASICAKVTRDLYMEKLSKKYPEYGFEIHKGYGTRAHYASIKKYGKSKVHRKSFLKKID
jgi:ribonuclease HII